ELEARQDSIKKYTVYGGMTQKEMTAWWKMYSCHLPNFDDNQKREIEDATGCIPLLLHFLVINQTSDPDDAISELAKCKETSTIFKHLAKYTKDIEVKGLQKEFLDIVYGCLLNRQMLYLSRNHYDNRYLYIDSQGFGRVSSGFARDAIVHYLRESACDYFL
ncbi:11650_t:CDS:2, partial [Paraglomus brasilianum]